MKNTNKRKQKELESIIFEYDEYKHDPIFDFDWKTDGWLLLGFIIFAGVIALTV